jgi:hydrogenase-4 component B
MTELLVLIGIGLAALSGVPGLAFGRYSPAGQWLATGLSLLAGAAGLLGVALFWAGGKSQPIDMPWPTVPGAAFSLAVDGLSAFFLVPIFLIALLGSVYGQGYWKQAEHPHNGRKLRLFYGLLIAGMALVAVARNGVLFLAGWEVMALAAYFLVTTEDENRSAQQAGWTYLVATHTATLALFALFALLRTASGSFELVPLQEGAAAPGLLTASFVLALFGFGIKAGIMPLHVWLPGAHAAAPSHVSALLSGVFIKLGVYGLFRIMSLLPQPPLEWGGILLALGGVSGVLGVVFAIAQHDLKRLLAYHSIENVGIIVMGLGLALLGRSLGRLDLIVLAAGGALLHVWNHAIFKALLFLSAGSVIHGTHTRDLDHLGGLGRRMPYTALAFLIGAVAICGLPPLNGFISEFLIYLGLFGSLSADHGSGAALAALAAPALALIGALAVACFVKVYGVVFLGNARSTHASGAHESGPSMIAPMAVLVACCFAIGLAPGWIAPILGQAFSASFPGLPDAASDLAGQVPFGWLSVLGLALLAGLPLAGGLLWRLVHRPELATSATWGCGYVAPTPRMQYTSSSFAQMLVTLFARVLWPRIHQPTVQGLFPRPTAFHSEVPDTVLDRAVVPAFRLGGRLASWFRVLQAGSIQTYLLYIFLALIVLLLWR